MLQKAKRREDWGQREKHPLYGLWNWHKSRNRYGMVSEWSENFWAFVAAVGERPSPDHRLRRHEIDQPMGPGNFFWDTKYAHGDASKTSREQRAEYMREYRRRRPRNVRSVELKSRFGIALEKWEEMHKAQGGVCAICGQPPESTGRYTNLCVDHCHATGKIRGLLCHACNRAIGLMKDDVSTLRKAAEYLEKGT